MAKAELGTKRTCPETEKKFYDLNKDPVVSPYTGKSYPLSFFDLPTGPSRNKVEEPVKQADPAPVEDEDETELEGAEVVSLEDADDDTVADDAKNLPDLGDNTDDDIADLDDGSDDDDDTFLAVDDDDDDDDVVGMVNVSGDDDDDN